MNGLLANGIQLLQISISKDQKRIIITKTMMTGKVVEIRSLFVLGGDASCVVWFAKYLLSVKVAVECESCSVSLQGLGKCQERKQKQVLLRCETSDNKKE